MIRRFQVGDRVRRSDVTERSIPAFRAARGRVVEVREDELGSRARVHWVGDSTPESGFRGSSTIELDVGGAT